MHGTLLKTSCLWEQVCETWIRVQHKGRMLGGAQAQKHPTGKDVGEEFAGVLSQYKSYGLRFGQGPQPQRGLLGPGPLGLGPLALDPAAPIEAVGLGRI